MSEAVLADLLAMSRELGRPEHGLVILGEGNTSALAADRTFYVKGSGSRLAGIGQEQFSRVRMDPVLALLDRPDADEQAIDHALRGALVEASAPKPSIETLLHAVCLDAGDVRFAGHTHAEAVNQVLCSRHGAEPFLRHLFPDAVVVCGRVPMVVPYADPGLPLALAYRAAFTAYRAEHGGPPKLVLLVNHGLIALGVTAREVLNITAMAHKWARILVGALAIGGARHLPAASVDAIDRRPDEHHRRRQLNRG